MIDVNLGGFRIRFVGAHVSPGVDGPIEVLWTLLIGLATPSIKFPPFAWNVLALDKRPGHKMTADFLRIGVGDGDE